MTAPNSVPERTRPDWGRPLTESDYAALAKSWITPELAHAAMLRRVDEQEARQIVGQKGKRDCAGVLIPYYWPGDPLPVNYRIRRDHPDLVQATDGTVKEDRKYLGAPGAANRLYIPPGITLEDLADLDTPIAIVEGEKKALALSRLTNHESDRLRSIPVAIPGVWNWRGVIGKTGGPKGERLDVKGPIPDLSRIAWDGRTVFILFDSNIHTNEEVRKARNGLGRHLTKAGAKVRHATLPEDCGVNGVDDLLAAWGPARVLDLFAKSTSGARLEVVLPPQFETRPDGLFRVTSRGERLTQVQLTNYQAAITANITLDNGVETTCEFEIAAELMGRRLQFTIPASEFTSMDWPIERMGAAAITFPNQRDYARTAIQSLSIGAEQRCIYTHTGWRQVDGQQMFLHAAGAIGTAGVVSGVMVRPFSSLRLYELQLPSGPGAVAPAVAATLRLLNLAPPAISFPLLAATFRAVLGEADFSMHLAGETGAFKSELAALHQQFFGAGMDRLHLPGSWSSTGNAIEAMAFYAKDALLVVDDFAPQGAAVDVARYHTAADRVFRAAGNHAGRGRLDSNANLRESKPPRALILSTGEEIPRGHSIRARLFILELEKGAIDPGALSECQGDGREGRYVEAMAAFIQRVAGRYEDVRAAFDRRLADFRTAATGSTAHARTPEIVANLQAGFELYLDFCVASGAIDGPERGRLSARCWGALQEAAATQAKHHKATEPTARYLEILVALLSSGRAHLEARNGGAPTGFQRSCGWRCDSSGNWSPMGDCVGWVEGDDIYLEPTAAFRLVQAAARDGGEALAISEQTLRKRLNDKHVLASVDAKRGTLTIRRMIGGSLKQVLHFSRQRLLPEAPEDFETDNQEEE
jgi:hypothetical protein